jgi:3',5'-cyclic AMP phosphodiesterase CpdA
MVINKKNCFIAIMLAMLFLLAACKAPAEEKLEAGADITIFVATDIHYMSKSLNDFGEAFAAFASSGDGKQINYIEEIVDAFAYDIERKKPDILIISGDLTSNGEQENHQKLAEKLQRIESHRTKVYVIPGNHDIQNPWARGFKGNQQYLTPTISKDDFAGIYNKFGYEEAISRDTASLSYLAAPSEDIWLLMLDTNQYEYNKMMGMPVTNGSIKEETMAWIRECSRQAQENHAKLITVMHHNLMDHSSVLSQGYTLDNSQEALKLFRESSLGLTLSGHIHLQDIRSDEKDSGKLYDIATSALSIYPQQYGVLKYSPKEGLDYSTAQVDVEAWSKEHGSKDRNLLNFETYSKDYFSKATYNKSYSGLQKLEGYTEAQKKQMAYTMSLLNTYYFGGSIDAVPAEAMESPGYKLLEKNTQGFLGKYMTSIIADSYRNKQELHIPNEEWKQ